MAKMIKIAFLRQFIWLVFSLSLLIFGSGISWQISKSANFFYSTWYQVLDINHVVRKNVPKNSQGKADFPVDDASMHERKFAEIVLAIHQSGNGLSEIEYLNQQGITQKLLTKSEVQHLQDVANLLTSVNQLWWGNVFFLLFLMLFYCRKHQSFEQFNGDKLPINAITVIPRFKQKLISLLFFVILIMTVLGIWGFTDIFYYLHTVVFPENHQWFFYYKDSLMATIMKAPDIFAAIAVQLVAVALLVAAGIDAAVSRYQRQ